jgi:hypothetical protein
MLVAGSNMKDINVIKKKLTNSFVMNDLGVAKKILGMCYHMNYQSLVGFWFLSKSVIFPCLSPFCKPNLKFFPLRLVNFSLFSLVHLNDPFFLVVLPKKSHP